MLKALDKNNNEVLSFLLKREDKEKFKGQAFTCCHCGKPAKLRLGENRRPHFSHQKKHSCSYDVGGETEAHYNAKIQIYEELKLMGLIPHIEKKFNTDGVYCIADVYFETPEGNKVAIEVQRSVIATEKLKARFDNYKTLGVHVLWVGLAQDLHHQFRSGIHHLKVNKMQQCMAENFDGKLYLWSAAHRGLVVVKLQSVEGFSTFKKPRYLVRHEGNDSYSDYFYAPVKLQELVCSARDEEGRAIERLLYQVEYLGLVDLYMKQLLLDGEGKPAKSFGDGVQVKAGFGIHSIKELFCK